MPNGYLYKFLGTLVKVWAGAFVPAVLAYVLTRLFTANNEYACYAALVVGMLGIFVVVTILEIRGLKPKRSQGQAE